jgi:hypothetical protein
MWPWRPRLSWPRPVRELARPGLTGSGYHAPEASLPAVITTARALVAAHGPGILREYAKVSFKTTCAVLENTP